MLFSIDMLGEILLPQLLELVLVILLPASFCKLIHERGMAMEKFVHGLVIIAHHVLELAPKAEHCALTVSMTFFN
jgi:hypothetical protein